MTDKFLTIPYTATGKRYSAIDTFVNLEQIKDNGFRDTVTMYDIQQMVARARSGMSAWSYKPDLCPAWIEGQTVVSEFDFYAWPSSPGLRYSLTASQGNISLPVVIQKDVEFSVTFEMSDVVEFDFMLEHIINWKWETVCYDNQGHVVKGVTVELDGLTTLRASAPVFGVVRIRAVKRGAKHTLTTRLVKTVHDPSNEQEFIDSGAGDFFSYDEWLRVFYLQSDVAYQDSVLNLTGVSISNLHAVVTAHWFDHGEEQLEQLKMEVPACLRDLLEKCWVDTDGDGIPDAPPGGGSGDGLSGMDGFGIGLLLCPGWKEKPALNVYVSGCTGKVLATVPADQDKNGWCGHD